MFSEIARFVIEDREHGAASPTLLAYAAADPNANAAAEQLLIHVNTANHRLSRIAAKIGCDLHRLRRHRLDARVTIRPVERQLAYLSEADHDDH
jgi:sugar diacid utilization regulator